MIDFSNTSVSTAKLPGKLKAFIFRDTHALSEDEPIYAINWFNTKMQWMYDFYNFLAVKAVRKIGGVPFFKGKYINTLQGEADMRRDILLVVRYPAITQFAVMLADGYFLAVSLIRMLAVKDFTFGLTKRSDAGPDLSLKLSMDSSSVSYAVHHFKAPDGFDIKLSQLITKSSVELFYAGSIKARIATGKTEEGCSTIPCLMDGLIILKSEEAGLIEALIARPEYQSLIAKTDSSFVGLYKRLL